MSSDTLLLLLAFGLLVLFPLAAVRWGVDSRGLDAEVPSHPCI